MDSDIKKDNYSNSKPICRDYVITMIENRLIRMVRLLIYEFTTFEKSTLKLDHGCSTIKIPTVNMDFGRCHF